MIRVFEGLGGLSERVRARRFARPCQLLADRLADNTPVIARGVVAALDETLVAPLSGRPCVAYRARVWARSLGGGARGFGETVQVRPFLLDLGDEEIVIAGDDAVYGLPRTPLPPGDVERRWSFAARHALGHERARFTEIAIEVGARIQVAGTLVLVPRDEPPHDERGFRDPPSMSQQIHGSGEHPLVFLAG